ncbi:peptidoglycan-recognition protein LF-like [Macrosteles quadrilineatus]|uniref:peptidoglycan-recognition protein LF-like n=1 Tax=Macrosteles quadrilineatus TaxID=74068 RepID=UPI0023E33DD9|nr:peptidoglycan-recognition protein LF-like [Macrosteles quadrilineatus]
MADEEPKVEENAETQAEDASPTAKSTKESAMERMIARDVWGAVKPMEQESLATPVSNIICTYTGTATCATQEECTKIIKDLQLSHMEEQKMTDIMYNFLIGGDGNIYEGRGWTTYAPPALKGKRYSGLDRKSINVAMVGDYKDADPPENMHMARKDLIDFGKEQNYIDPNTAAMWHGF